MWNNKIVNLFWQLIKDLSGTTSHPCESCRYFPLSMNQNMTRDNETTTTILIHYMLMHGIEGDINSWAVVWWSCCISSLLHNWSTGGFGVRSFERGSYTSWKIAFADGMVAGPVSWILIQSLHRRSGLTDWVSWSTWSGLSPLCGRSVCLRGPPSASVIR